MALEQAPWLAHEPRIASAGYEGRTLDELLDALVDIGVDLLVDVRENAISRKKGFSKRGLTAACADRGIEYVHEPTLGNPRSNREGFRAGQQSSRDCYRDHLTANGRGALEHVAALLRGRTVALLCYEADPADCHRSIVAEELARLDPLVTVHAI